MYLFIHLLYTKIDKLINTQPINYTFFVKQNNFFSQKGFILTFFYKMALFTKVFKVKNNYTI